LLSNTKGKSASIFGTFVLEIEIQIETIDIFNILQPQASFHASECVLTWEENTGSRSEEIALRAITGIGTHLGISPFAKTTSDCHFWLDHGSRGTTMVAMLSICAIFQVVELH